MSTPTRGELAGKTDQLKDVVGQIIKEMQMLDNRISGLYAFIQQLPNYEEIVEELKEKSKKSDKPDEKKLEI
jgi:prefoldin subunit 5|tara:strand:+ start:5980 stop:6195 length:216 start_codon:yes stop_codon:yes gene_type:complete